MPNPFIGYDNIVPLLAPVDIASNITISPWMDLRHAQKAAFLISFGAVTSASAADAYVITIASATVETGTQTAIDFRYRISAATGTNTWGAVTTVAAATGLPIVANGGDSMTVFIEIDPDALGMTGRYVHVVLTDVDDMSACLVSIIGFCEARYKQLTHVSASAAASA